LAAGRFDADFRKAGTFASEAAKSGKATPRVDLPRMLTFHECVAGENPAPLLLKATIKRITVVPIALQVYGAQPLGCGNITDCIDK